MPAMMNTDSGDHERRFPVKLNTYR
jgi:hypothetical protein